jgi:hypothetical protein
MTVSMGRWFLPLFPYPLRPLLLWMLGCSATRRPRQNAVPRKRTVAAIFSWNRLSYTRPYAWSLHVTPCTTANEPPPASETARLAKGRGSVRG